MNNCYKLPKKLPQYDCSGNPIVESVKTVKISDFYAEKIRKKEEKAKQRIKPISTLS